MSLATFLQKIPTIIVVIVAMLLTYQLALLTWIFVSDENTPLSWEPVTSKGDKNKTQINTAQLQQQHLFGKASEVTQEAHSSAPKTRLKLKLVGIVAATVPEYSSVIIDHKGVQGSYFVDSKIDGTSAMITHIYPDRIILDVKGVKQTLILDGSDEVDKKSNSKKKSTKNKKRPSKRDVKKLDVDREKLLSDPGKLTDYISITPVRKDGKVEGYRVKPGKDKSFFEGTGLKSGDLAVELNGIDLTDTQEAFTLMKEFPTMTDITLSVERDGQLHEIYLSIP